MPITFGQLKNPPSTLPAKVNLCPTDARFADLCNRAHDLLLEHGSWWGTEQECNLAINDSCVTMPAPIANIEGVRACDSPVAIENQWYRMTPGFNPQLMSDCASSSLWLEYRDQVPTFTQLKDPVILRCFISQDSDIGRTIKFIGYDQNGKWIRSRQNGLWQDGELLTLAQPYVETVNQFKSITAIVKQETDDMVRVFSHPRNVAGPLNPVGLYHYYETCPSYQRYKVMGWCGLNQGCASCRVVTARVKLAFVPVKYDDDIFLIQNRQALEYAVQAMKAIDDGNITLADTLLFGSAQNTRVGAIPLLEQELRTHTGDRFVGNVQIVATRAIKRQMTGFI